VGVKFGGSEGQLIMSKQHNSALIVVQEGVECHLECVPLNVVKV